MKQTVQFQRIQEKMKPGKLTRDGFLGKDGRNLVDILIDDDADVRRMDTSHAIIAKYMRRFRKKGEKGLGEFIPVEPHFEVRVDGARGKLPCPFEHPGMFRKMNTIVNNLKLNRQIIYSDLNIHMVESHGFYEGKGSFFRTDPTALVDVLEIPPQELE